MVKTKKQTGGKFLRITCPRCKKQRMVFGKATTLVKCEECNYLLLQTGGGKSRIRAPVREVLSK